MIAALTSVGLSAGLIGGTPSAFGGGGPCYVNGVAAYPELRGNGDRLLLGTKGDDVIICSPQYWQDMIIKGKGGSDTITGSTASDRIYGGPGDDTLTGADGNDECWGGAGSDAIDCEVAHQ